MALNYLTAQELLERVFRKTNSTFSVPTIPSPNREVMLTLDVFNEACSYIFNKYHLNELTKVVTVVLQNGVETYDFSNAPYNIPYWRNNRLGIPAFKDKNLDLPLIAVDKEDLYSKYRVNRVTSTTPSMWFKGEGNTVGFYPKPSTGIPVEMIYTPSNYCTDSLGVAKSKVTLGTDIVLIPEEFEDYLIYKTCYLSRQNLSNNDKTSMFAKNVLEYETLFASKQITNGYPVQQIKNIERNGSRGLNNLLYRQGSKWV